MPTTTTTTAAAAAGAGLNALAAPAAAATTMTTTTTAEQKTREPQIRWLSRVSGGKSQAVVPGHLIKLVETMERLVRENERGKPSEKKRVLMPKKVAEAFKEDNPELFATNPEAFKGTGTIALKTKAIRDAAGEVYATFLESLPPNATAEDRRKVGLHKEMSDEQKDILKNHHLVLHGARAWNLLERIGLFVKEQGEDGGEDEGEESDDGAKAAAAVASSSSSSATTKPPSLKRTRPGPLDADEEPRDGQDDVELVAAAASPRAAKSARVESRVAALEKELASLREMCVVMQAQIAQLQSASSSSSSKRS